MRRLHGLHVLHASHSSEMVVKGGKKKNEKETASLVRLEKRKKMENGRKKKENGGKIGHSMGARRWW